MTARKAVFIDRDGVINVVKNYVYKISDFELLDGVVEGLKLLSKNNFLLILITNQAGIAHGYYCESDVESLHNYLQKYLNDSGVQFTGIYFCPHHPQGIISKYRIDCSCRKPKPGMIFKAVADFNIDLSKSYLIGDKISDIEAGIQAQIHTNILVQSGHKIEDAIKSSYPLVLKNLFEASVYIINKVEK